jgi:hypothetical protein
MKISTRLAMFLSTFLLAIFLLAGCESITIQLVSSRPATRTSIVRVERNNQIIRLAPGNYEPFNIDKNSVRIIGAGVERTSIGGNMLIEGNDIVLEDVTIRGNVVIRGNNNDLRRARILGDIRNLGRNNRW